MPLSAFCEELSSTEFMPLSASCEELSSTELSKHLAETENEHHSLKSLQAYLQRWKIVFHIGVHSFRIRLFLYLTELIYSMNGDVIIYFFFAFI
jgi:hypothetical protein